MIVWLSLTSAEGAWFGYYDQPLQNPGGRREQIREQGTYSDVTWSVRPWVEGDWETAKAENVLVVVHWPHEFWLAVDAGKPLSPDLPMWCHLPTTEDPEGWCNKTAREWVAVVQAHQEQIAFLSVVDEYDCGNTWYPIDTEGCRRAAAKIEANLAAARLSLPGVKLHVNYTSQWVSMIAEHAGTPTAWRLGYYGVSLSSADFNSFDCYTPFHQCARSGTTVYSVPMLVAGMVKVMAPWQQVVLIPRAFAGSFLTYAPSPAEVAATAWAYYEYSTVTPRVAGIFPFIYWDLMGSGTGARSVPAIRSAYEQIGMAMTGRPGPPPPAAPTGLRLAREW